MAAFLAPLASALLSKFMGGAVETNSMEMPTDPQQVSDLMRKDHMEGINVSERTMIYPWALPNDI